MLALFGSFGTPEIILIAIVAVLVFGTDLPQAASTAYLQLRKLRNAVDDLRRDSGIEREIRDIERSVREAEWEARKKTAPAAAASVARGELPPSAAEPAAPAPAPAEARPGPEAEAASSQPSAPERKDGEAPTGAAS